MLVGAAYHFFETVKSGILNISENIPAFRFTLM